MYSVLIVDDDLAIREGLSILLKEIEPMARLLTAQTGAEALRLVMQHSVELILTDIKMPIMDGLELIENLRMLNYQGEVVIISGFDEFSLVRKALKLGAADYLLKPVKLEELRNVCLACSKKLEHSTHSSFALGKQVSQDNIHLQQAWLNALLQGGEEAERVRSEFTEMPARLLCVAMDLQAADSAGRGNTLICLADAFRKAQEASSFSASLLIHGEHSGYWLVLFHFSGKDESPLHQLVSQELSRRGIHCGVSAVYPANEQIQAFWDARELIRRGFFDLPLSPTDAWDPYPFTKTSAEVLSAFAKEDWHAFHNAIEAMFVQIAADQPERKLIQLHLRSLVYALMNQNEDFIAIMGKYKLSDKDILLRIMEGESFSTLRQSFKSLLHLYLSEALERRLASEDSYVQKAKQYVAQHCSTGLSLGEVSRELGLNPNYFSTLFHQKTDETFTEHVRSVRISKAIRLLNTTNMKVYEIALQCGYNDTAQFYRAFHQVVGVAPGKYKKLQNAAAHAVHDRLPKDS